MKKVIVTLLVLALVAGIGLFIFNKLQTSEPEPIIEETPIEEVVPEIPTPEPTPEPFEVIGASVENRDIQAYRFGSGAKKLVFVGGIHGGYEWNSAMLSYEMIDYFTANQSAIPGDISVIVIPVANPDGLYAVVGTTERFSISQAPQFEYADDIEFESPVAQARFNANGVDLNRNFDCKWQPNAKWREYDTKGGTEAFSEPEAKALRDFILQEQPEAVVFYHSASNGVYTSFCEGEALPGTVDLLSAYTDASGYQKFEDYPYYEVTGDAADWLSTQGIPAITVELATHTAIEWEKNRKGIEAMFELYSTSATE